LGIQTLLITEYLEQTPLARAEWLKFFGVMTGNKMAEAVFNEIETSYLKQVQKQSIGSVALNLPFGDQWNMPSGKSITAQLLKDAGLDYLFSNKQLDGNVVLSMEEGYDALSKADYWVTNHRATAGIFTEGFTGGEQNLRDFSICSKRESNFVQHN
jgi:iron complex transport system substrate-binding protein